MLRFFMMLEEVYAPLKMISRWNAWFYDRSGATMHDDGRCLGDVFVPEYPKLRYSHLSVRVDADSAGSVKIGPMYRGQDGVWCDSGQGPYFLFCLPLASLLSTLIRKGALQRDKLRYVFCGRLLGELYMYHSRMAADEGSRSRGIDHLEMALSAADEVLHIEFYGAAGPVDPSETIESLDIEKHPVTFTISVEVRINEVPVVFSPSSDRGYIERFLRKRSETSL